MADPKTFYLRTYGCQMNELDSEILAGQLLNRGLSRIDTEQGADLLIYNTCSIRDLAERKVMGKLGQLGRKSKKPLIGITGCMAMAKRQAIFRKFPFVNFVLGTNNIMDINDVLDEVLYSQKQVCRTEDSYEENINYLVAKRDQNVKAFVSIIRGCDKFCTYCVVPYTRGKEVSRPCDSIVEECKRLVEHGYKEVTLLGQNVNSYGKDFKDQNFLFHDLLYKLDEIKGLERIRFMTSHPIDITVDLMKAIRDLPSVCEFVHFPMQAGSSRVLRKMHRIYTKEQYIEKVHLLREIVPDVTLGTDIIVGFPTETDAEFQETADLFEQIRYTVAFIYAYSPRKGTPAMRWKDDVPESVKQQRLQHLLKIHNRISEEENRKFLGTVQDVLVERENKDGENLKGRTRHWNKVIFPGDKSRIGTMQKVLLEEYNYQTFIGKAVSAPLLVASQQAKPMKRGCCGGGCGCSHNIEHSCSCS